MANKAQSIRENLWCRNHTPKSTFPFHVTYFSFCQGSEFLHQQSSLTSTAGCVMLQNISKESFERTITIAKGNSSLGKFLIFHTHLPTLSPPKEERSNPMYLAVVKKIDVINFPVVLWFLFLRTHYFSWNG